MEIKILRRTYIFLVSYIQAFDSHFLIKPNAMKQFSFFLLFLFFTAAVSAQVSVTATAGTTGPSSYTTLKLAFDAINAGTHQGSVTVNITANTIETATAMLNASGSGAAIYTAVLVKPAAGATPVVTGALANAAVIKLNGSNNVTIDGSNNGSTSRNLTISNTSVTTPNVLVIGSAGTTAINNITVKNSTLINGVNSSACLVAGDAGTVGNAGYFSNINIQNNSIQKSYFGVFLNAVVAGVPNAAVTLTGNDLNTTGANSIRFVGIYAQGVDGLTVSNNNIGNFEAASGEFDRGIWLATATKNTLVTGNTISGLSYSGVSTYAPIGINVSSGITNCNVTVTNNTITGITSSGSGTTTGIYFYSALSGLTINRNTISNIKNTNTTGYGAAGIVAEASLNTAASKINNNFISDVAGYGFNGYDIADNGNGIVINAGGGYDVDFNTVVLNNNPTLTGGHRASCMLITANVSSSGTINMRNNIFANLQTVGNANSRLAISVVPTSGTAVFGVENYNDYYSTSTNLSSIGTNGSITNTIAQLRTSLGGNLNSINVQPVFVSATDFHLSNAAGANWCLDGAGLVVSGITTDIDGQTRSTGVAPLGPDMGADEFTTTGTGAATPASQTICSGATITSITSTGVTTYSWTRDNVVTVTGIAASGTGSITGALTNTTASPITVTFTITPLNAAGCAGPAFAATVTVTPSVSTPVFALGATSSRCQAAGVVTYGATANNTTGITYSLDAGSTGAGNSINATTGAVTFTAAWSGTSIITASAAGCSGPATATHTVTVNAGPTATVVTTEPTTCTSTNGAINITVAGAGPYSYAWTGNGVITANEDQTGLTAGVYTVVITNTATTCSSTYTYTLNGPGGCNVCPTIPSLTPAPTTAVCIGSTVGLTASGLTSMGSTYGIQFKYFAAATATPYTGGTTIATVSNGALTGGGSTATTTTTFPAAGTYYVYAVLSPVPVDPSCRPSATATVVINPTPTVNAVTNQTVCNNGNTAAVTFSGAVAGTVYNWTNNTPSIGLAASGTGNIASFAGTNTTTAPVTATITVTPSYTSGGGTCTGMSTTFTITVNPLATVTAVANQTVCRNANTAAVNFTSPTTGGTIVYNWTNSNTAIGLAGSGTGNIASFVGSNTTTAPLTSTITVTPSYTNGVTCAGTAVSFTITVNPTATVNTVANQTVCNNTSTTAVNFTSPTTGGTIVYNWTNNTPSIGLAATGTGNIAAFTAVNTTTSPVTASITVTPSYTNNATTCTGTPITFTITVNPTPAATIAYTGSPYCTSAGTATVTRTGTAGGVYSSAAALTLNATTGDVTLGTSTAGTYTVTYTIAAAGGCAAFTTTASITITSAFTATISYPAAPYCINGGSAAVTRTGTAGGTYTSTAGLVIDAATGAVNLNTSTAGTYTVTYTINASGGCPLFSTTTTITINSLSVAPIAAVASNPTICANSGVTNLSVTGGTLGTGASYKWYTGSCGGTLFGTGATLTNVTLFSTTTFYVRAEGPCGNTTCASVTVNVNPAPSVTLVASNSNNVTPSSHTTLNASVSPAGNYLFQFFRNGVSVFLTTNTANQVVLPVSPDSAGSYTVQVINIASGCSATAGPVVITSNNTSHVFIAPNPNHGKFSVKYYATGAEINAMRSVAVYDGRGARVFDKTMKITGTYTLMDVDITHSASGTYFVKVSDANGKILSSTAVLVMP